MPTPTRTCALAAALAAALVLLLVYVLAYRRAAAALAGCWAGEADWLAAAGLGGALLVLDGGRGRLVLVDAAGAPLADAELGCARGWLRGATPLERARAPCDFSARGDGELPEGWPARATLTLCALAGTLTVHDGERVYGHFVRDVTSNRLLGLGE